ncbi:LysR family transcriptional regulator [Pseudomonas oryzihabitans]|uniref:LysR family transcriptional regulator n=1 Tax=Pseudomonas oryzihabitans TaxID=47885 RepID=UPI0028606144|nr:LysR family transcriptional regulator [Pseudomonas psychrotolerans]MDR6680191.1 DNA-binding transcriptional LysR family regulator [Pseudomonas psychrotolerans]
MDRFTALQVFSETVKRGSISAAAEHLNLSRAMASRYITLMEEWTGSRLLHRTTRRLSLTVAGEQALLLCQEILTLTDGLAAMGPGLESTPRGKLKITSNSIFAEHCLTGLIIDFLTIYPEIQVDLQIADRTVDLAEEGIDLAIRVSGSLAPNLYARNLGNCSSVLCASRAYLDEHGTPGSLSDLKKHNCLTYTYFGQSVWRFHKDNNVVSLPVTGSISTNEAAILLKSTRMGAGISILPLFAIEHELLTGELVALLTEFELDKLAVSAVYLSQKKIPQAQRELIDYLVRNLRLP